MGIGEFIFRLIYHGIGYLFADIILGPIKNNLKQGLFFGRASCPKGLEQSIDDAPKDALEHSLKKYTDQVPGQAWVAGSSYGVNSKHLFLRQTHENLWYRMHDL